jgi:hypothetical protein
MGAGGRPGDLRKTKAIAFFSRHERRGEERITVTVPEPQLLPLRGSN